MPNARQTSPALKPSIGQDANPRDVHSNINYMATNMVFLHAKVSDVPRDGISTFRQVKTLTMDTPKRIQKENGEAIN